MLHTYQDVVIATTKNYVEDVLKTGINRTIAEHVANLLGLLQDIFEQENVSQPKGAKWKYLDKLPVYCIAYLMSKFGNYCRINMLPTQTGNNNKNMLLARYQEDGVNKGTWSGGTHWSEIDGFLQEVNEYNPFLTNSQRNELYSQLFSMVPVVERTEDPDLSAFNNGIFDWKNQTLLPFDPKYVFLSKCHIDFKLYMTEPMITEPDGNIWTFDKWLSEISTNDEMKNALYAVLQAVVRPYQHWDKIVFFCAPSGNNGKSTLATVCKQLAPAFMSVKLADLGKDFHSSEILTATMLIGDENDSGGNEKPISETVAKALATGDEMQLNIKYRDPITIKANPLLLQQYNTSSGPKLKDTTDSMLRRMYIIIFRKCFTGVEKKYIKHNYLTRKEVLEWVVYHLCMEMPALDEFPTLADMQDSLEEFRNANNSVAAFWSELESEFTWNFLPNAFLYDLYKSWYETTHANTLGCMGKTRFITELRTLLEKNPHWEEKKSTTFSWNQEEINGKRCGDVLPELLIAEYDLNAWKNRQFKDSIDISKKCKPIFDNAKRFNGFLRV